GLPQVEVRLFPGYRGQLRRGVRFVLSGRNPVGIELVGGTDESASPLPKGATVPSQSPGEAGERAGSAIRNWLQQSGESVKELGRSLKDKDLLRTIEEELRSQPQSAAPGERTN
ncbi:MAG: hypothetical protein EBS01_09095, partial [Verrucomicrobia bacterium]|nr:hypothetical protein [Verrucomicrobiota bacterium]